MSRLLSIFKRIIDDNNYVKLMILKKLSWLFSDRTYLELLFPLRTGYRLNLDNPVSFNEKIQWLKLYDHNPDYTRMVDKYEAKLYVSSLIGDDYIIPTLGLYNNVDEI